MIKPQTQAQRSLGYACGRLYSSLRKQTAEARVESCSLTIDTLSSAKADSADVYNERNPRLRPSGYVRGYNLAVCCRRLR
jgi:hypothetical protein